MVETAQTTQKLEYRQTDGSTLALCMSGPWRFSDGLPAVEDVRERLAGQAGLKRVVLQDAGITQWDSGCLTFLLHARQQCESKSLPCDCSELPEGIRKLMALATAVEERKDARHEAARPSFLARVGLGALSAAATVRSTLEFVGESILAFVTLLRGRSRMLAGDLWAIIQECGPEALPIVTIISVLVGMILAFLGSVQLKMFGAEIYVADLVGIGMAREMGALMTGIIMAGRTGAAFAARLGTMQVNEEIDALQTMGFSPMDVLVLPRMLALILMMPLLTLYANFLGMVGGAIVGITMLDLTPMQYYLQTAQAVSLKAIASGLIKSSVFGVVVAISGCMQGIRCGRSASAVGDATTAAVVNAIVYIIVADSLLSILYTVVGI